MVFSIEQLNNLLCNSESLNLEFKIAKINFSDRDRSDYCAGIANSGGGYLLLGVDDKGEIAGTDVYKGTVQKIPEEVHQAIGIWIEIEEVDHPKGRVVIFCIPSRDIGRRVRSNGSYKYPIRKGESLVEMDDTDTKNILNETQKDFSAQVVKGVNLSDLDDEAIKSLRNILIKNNKNILADLSDEKLFAALELVVESKVTFAGLILLGKKEKIDELLPCSEIIFEWRQDQKVNHNFRQEWREPFLKVYDVIWKTISNRNIRMPFQEGFIQREILAFNEKAIREALLNAVTHRDYSVFSQSIFIKASPDNLTIISPGGFLPGITPENIIEKQASRNRRIAEVFQKLGLVERSGQGVDQIFEVTIRDGKGLPDFIGTDNFQVVLNIPAQVKDKDFILFLEKVSRERQVLFSFYEVYELELLREQHAVNGLKNKKKFLDLGIIEKVGNTSGTKYILSHKYYTYENKPGVYTRIKGLSRQHKKELILEHIKRENVGSRQDFIDAFPELQPKDISNLLQELKNEKKIVREGSDKVGIWKLS